MFLFCFLHSETKILILSQSNIKSIFLFNNLLTKYSAENDAINKTYKFKKFSNIRKPNKDLKKIHIKKNHQYLKNET